MQITSVQQQKCSSNSSWYYNNYVQLPTKVSHLSCSLTPWSPHHLSHPPHHSAPSMAKIYPCLTDPIHESLGLRTGHRTFVSDCNWCLHRLSAITQKHVTVCADQSHRNTGSSTQATVEGWGIHRYRHNRQEACPRLTDSVVRERLKDQRTPVSSNHFPRRMQGKWHPVWTAVRIVINAPDPPLDTIAKGTNA